MKAEMKTPEPVTLEGEVVRLEPLVAEYHGELMEIALDPRIWEVGLSRVHDGDTLRDYIDAALDMQCEGSGLPFLIRGRASGKAVGSTRYGNIETAHRT